MLSDTNRDRTRGNAAKLATLERRNARKGKRARKWLAFEAPRALQLAGGGDLMATAPTPRPLAKSLHTVTALQRVALYLASRPGSNLNAEEATSAALDVLGYAGAPDPYGLASRARSGLPAGLHRMNGGAI